jgi:hypothetical protein
MPAGTRANEWASRVATRLAGRIDPVEAERLTRRLLATIDEVAADRWEAAVERAATLPGSIRPEKIQALTNGFARELGAAGAAAGAAAAAPTVGTMATLLATSAELAWFTGRAGDLILTIAAVHGRPEPTVDERRAWVLAVLIYGGSARDEFAHAINTATTGVSVVAPDRRVPITAIQAANRLMSKMMLRRYGARRGAVALGRLLPAGIGAVIGGTSNYTAIRTLARHADQFFARLPYSAIDVESVDITGRELPGRAGSR